MGQFNHNEADNYGNGNSGSFFSLKNDGDIARVRFMYNDINDVIGYAVHEVEVDGKKRYVNCLRSYNEPVDNCPLCAAKNKVIAKIFIPLYDLDDEEIKIWDRGKTYLAKLSSLSARYNPLVSMPFEIERHGKKGDTNTTYEIFPLERDEITLEDLPEVPSALGTIILDKTYEDLDYYLINGVFPKTDDEEEEPVRRPQAGRASTQPGRTAPATSRPGTEAPARRGSTPAGNSNTTGLRRRDNGSNKF